jgi:hypothetical protein
VRDLFLFVPAQDADERAQAILKIIGPLESPTLNFHPVDHVWAESLTIQFCTKPVYKAETSDRIVEVADIAPYASGRRPDGATYTTERLVAIYPKDKKPGEKDTVFMRLSPNFSPSVNIVTGPGMSNAGLVTKSGGENVELAMQVVTALVAKIGDRIPLPEWVNDFDKKFEFQGQAIYARAPKA